MKEALSNCEVVLVDQDVRRRTGLASALLGFGLKVVSRADLPEAEEWAPPPSRPPVLLVALSGGKSPLLPRLKALKQARRAPAVIGLASAHQAGELLAGLEEGVLDQVADPANPAGLFSAVRSERLRVRLVRQSGLLAASLRSLKKEHAEGLRRALELEEKFETTLENFMAALDLRDVETYGHSKTVARYSHVLSEALGIRDSRTLDNIRKGALLHDAGKMAIPDSVLKKPGPLTAGEWDIIRRHPALGYSLIKDVKLVKEVGNIILCHHERFDGSGYPRGLKGSAIPLEARIFAVADTLDAVTSHRPYRSQRDFRVAKNEVTRGSGGQFDPAVVEAFLTMDLAVWEKIRFETTRILPAVEGFRSVAVKK